MNKNTLKLLENLASVRVCGHLASFSEASARKPLRTASVVNVLVLS